MADWSKFGESLERAGSLISEHLLDKYKRKKDLEDYEKQLQMQLEKYTQQQEPQLERQRQFAEGQADRESFESQYGKNEYLYDLYRGARSGEPVAKSQWMTFEDIDTTLKSHKSLTTDQNERLKRLNPAIQSQVLNQAFKVDQELEDIGRKEESHAASMGEVKSREKARKDIERYRGESLKLRKEGGIGGYFKNVVGKARHKEYGEWEKKQNALKSDIEDLEAQTISRERQLMTATKENKPAYHAELLFYKDKLRKKRDELGKLAGELPATSMSELDTTSINLAPEDEQELMAALYSPENETEDIDDIIRKFYQYQQTKK